MLVGKAQKLLGLIWEVVPTPDVLGKDCLERPFFRRSKSIEPPRRQETPHSCEVPVSDERLKHRRVLEGKGPLLPRQILQFSRRESVADLLDSGLRPKRFTPPALVPGSTLLLVRLRQALLEPPGQRGIERGVPRFEERETLLFCKDKGVLPFFELFPGFPCLLPQPLICGGGGEGTRAEFIQVRPLFLRQGVIEQISKENVSWAAPAAGEAYAVLIDVRIWGVAEPVEVQPLVLQSAQPRVGLPILEGEAVGESVEIVVNVGANGVLRNRGKSVNGFLVETLYLPTREIPHVTRRLVLVSLLQEVSDVGEVLAPPFPLFHVLVITKCPQQVPSVSTFLLDFLPVSPHPGHGISSTRFPHRFPGERDGTFALVGSKPAALLHPAVVLCGHVHQVVQAPGEVLERVSNWRGEVLEHRVVHGVFHPRNPPVSSQAPPADRVGIHRREGGVLHPALYLLPAPLHELQEVPPSRDDDARLRVPRAAGALELEHLQLHRPIPVHLGHLCEETRLFRHRGRGVPGRVGLGEQGAALAFGVSGLGPRVDVHGPDLLPLLQAPVPRNPEIFGSVLLQYLPSRLGVVNPDEVI